MLSDYLPSIPSPMHRARAKAALEAMVRVNGATMLRPRHAVIEDRVKSGSKVIDRKGEIVFMSPEGSWLDCRNITKHGLNYAAWLSIHS